MLDHNTFNFTWRGLYEFKESARKDIIEHFKNLKDYGDIMKVQFDPSRNSFTLMGPKDRAEEAQQTFIGVINTFINRLYTQSLGDKQYITRGKISRPTTTTMFIRDLEWTDDPSVVYRDDHDDIFDVFEEIRHEVEGVKFEKFHKWSPMNRATFRECFFPDGADLIGQIAEGTRCIMKVDWVTRDVNIGAHSQIALEAGLEKLNLAEKIFSWDYKKSSAHIVHSGGKTFFEIRLVAIVKQSTTILRSTLFPPDDQYSSLGGRDRLASARLAEYNPESDKYENVSFSCAPVYNAGQMECQVWKGYTYPPHIPKIKPRVPILQDPLLSFSIPSSRPSETVDAVSPRPQPQDVASSVPTHKPSISVAPMKVDAATGALSFGDRPQDTTVNISDDEPIVVPTMAPKRKARKPRTTGNVAAAPSTPADTITLGSASIHSMVPTQQAPSANPESTRGTFTMASTRPGDSSEVADNSSTSAPPPYATRRPRNARKAKNRPAPEPEHSRKEESVADSASIAASDQSKGAASTMSYASSAATAKPTNEYQTRTYKNTQNQHAPRRKTIFDNYEALRKHQDDVLHMVFSEGFEDVRRFCGELKFEAKIGRICFPLVPKKFLKSSFGFQWSNFQSELEKAKIQTLFTDIISIWPSDSDFIAGLKVAGGELMFESPPSSQKVTYEIEGFTFQKEPFTIVVDAKTFEFEVLGKEHKFGNVYVNCPLSTWDADFRLTGHKLLKSVEGPAKKLVESMDIDPGLEFPTFTIDIEDLDLEITGCVCRRSTNHMIVPSDVHQGHEFTLVLTENIQLRPQEREDMPGIMRFCGVEGLDSFRQNMTWYSASIVSDPIEHALWKNRYLKVTEITDSTAKDILFQKGSNDKTMLQTMLQLMCNLIPKINNVGYDNVQYTLHTA